MRGVVGVLVLVACGGHGVPRTPTPPAITILDPGAEPRVQLRYTPTRGTIERFEITVKSKLTTTVTNTVLETGTTTIDVPSIKTTVLCEPTDVSPTDFGVKLSIADVTVLDDALDASIVSRLKKETSQLKGVHTSWRQSPRGEITNVIVDGPRSTSPMLVAFRSGADPHPVVFPEQPVGVGSRWNVTRHRSDAGIAWDETSSFHLTALTDAAATIEMDVDANAGPQALAVEPNATTKLTTGRIVSRSVLVVPRHGVYATGIGQNTTEVRMSIVRNHLRLSSTVVTDSTVQIERAPQPQPTP